MRLSLFFAVVGSLQLFDMIMPLTGGGPLNATQTMVSKIDDDTYQVQTVAWYDNENSYTSQMVRTIKHFGKLLNA